MKLQDMLIEASQKYYTSGDSGMTDAEFDAKLAELKQIDPSNPIVTAVGHGYDVTLDTTPGEKVKHKYGVAGSLSKCHNWEEFTQEFSLFWRCCPSLKLDGMSVVLYYSKGQLVQALTRGDGYVGVDITDKIKLFKPEYMTIEDNTFVGSVRGEIVMSYKQFEEFKLNVKPDAKNPRNSTVGLINSKYTKDEDYKYLDIVVYTVTGCEDTNHAFLTYNQMREWLESQFSTCVKYMYVGCVSQSSFDETMTHLRDCWYGEYPADGIVLTSDDLSCNGHEIVYSAVAYKFNDDHGISRVIDIEWNLSKTKYLVPRIHVETIQLSGTDVSWVHGDNAKNIMQNGLGPGAEVELVKSGEIIPDIVKVITPSTAQLPVICPCCGSDLVWSGVHLACPNTDCSDSHMQDLLIWTQFISPADNLGDALKTKFFAEMKIVSIDSLYTHDVIPNDESRGAQYNTFVNMYNGLFTNKISAVNAIRALNVPRFGEATSARLAAMKDLVVHIVTSFDDVPEEYRSKIGDANFDALVEYRSKFTRLQYIYDNIVWEESESKEVIGTVVITGKLSVKRTQFESELADHGYKVSDSVKSTTFALITDDPNSSSSKNKKAAELGIQKLTEHQFREQYMR